MFSFNLLPPTYQQQARRWIVVAQLNRVVASSLFFALTLIATLASVILYMERLITTEQAQVTTLLQRPTGSDVMADLQTLNLQIRSLSDIQKKHHTDIELIDRLIALTPDTVSLQSLAIQYDKETVHFTGVASDRSALKLFQERIEGSEEFTLEEFPFGEFTQSIDIPFDIELSFEQKAFILHTL